MISRNFIIYAGWISTAAVFGSAMAFAGPPQVLAPIVIDGGDGHAIHAAAVRTYSAAQDYMACYQQSKDLDTVAPGSIAAGEPRSKDFGIASGGMKGPFLVTPVLPGEGHATGLYIHDIRGALRLPLPPAPKRESCQNGMLYSVSLHVSNNSGISTVAYLWVDYSAHPVVTQKLTREQYYARQSGAAGTRIAGACVQPQASDNDFVLWDGDAEGILREKVLALVKDADRINPAASRDAAQGSLFKDSLGVDEFTGHKSPCVRVFHEAGEEQSKAFQASLDANDTQYALAKSRINPSSGATVAAGPATAAAALPSSH